MNNRRKLLVVLGAGALAASYASFAQPQTKVWRIGYLATSDPATMRPQLNEFREGMRERGYVEGKNLTIEYRWAVGSLESRPEIAVELVNLKVDAIFVFGTPAAVAAKKATSTIPIVFVGVGDPLGSGIVASLARPGGNITGVSNIAGDLSAKLMQLLSQAAPNMKRVAVLRNPANALAVHQLKDAEPAARSLGLQLEVFDVRSPADFETAYAGMAKSHVGGVVLFGDPLFTGYSKQLAELAIRFRILSIYVIRTYPEAGGLMSYGPGLDIFRLAATFVDKILKGAKPTDLPVEQPTRLELVINGKTAKALGLTIPQSLLISADKVIE
jgi:putative ABC transport system substrate-binding protein